MNRQYFTVELQSDIVFSETAATVGGHSSLNFIPGASFYGFAASSLYDFFIKAGISYDIFHSGKVRFSNAYPLTNDDAPMLPVPLSWHVLKGEAAHKGGSLVPENIHNLVCVSEETFKRWEYAGSQPQQMREGYFSACGRFSIPPMSYRMKTAIDRTKRGRPGDEQLFGYEGLRAGIKWYFSIDADRSLSGDAREKLYGVVCGKSVRIGKSRTAEYGNVKIRRIGDEKINFDALFPSGLSDGTIFIYCLSDIALRAAGSGCPTLIPSPEEFGLKNENAFLPHLSYIRTRTYTPFNGYRKAHDLERYVISKGSVIAFRLGKGTLSEETLKEVIDKVRSGVGIYRYEGLGRVLVNPQFLLTEHFIPQPWEKSEEKESDSPIPDDILGSWVHDQKYKRDLAKDAVAFAGIWVKDLSEGMRRARRGYPSRTQWGRLREIAASSASLSEVRQRLFEGQNALCTTGVSKEKWAMKFLCEGSAISFREYLDSKVVRTALTMPTEDEQLAFLKRALHLIGEQLPHVMNQGGIK